MIDAADLALLWVHTENFDEPLACDLVRALIGEIERARENEEDAIEKLSDARRAIRDSADDARIALGRLSHIEGWSELPYEADKALDAVSDCLGCIEESVDL